jgi:hypothetical protein
VNQAERLARREELRGKIAEHEDVLAKLRAEEAKLLEGCEHAYGDGRAAMTGAQVKICAICGKLLRARDEKLWG